MSRAARHRPLVAAVASVVVFASFAVSQDERFGETTDVVLIQIPVHVTQNGVPVRNLGIDDFEVREGRKKQEIVALDVFDLELAAQAGDEATEAVEATVPPAIGRRNFLLLFDLSNSAPAGIIRAREAALDLARRSLHPSDLVAVGTYSKVSGAQIVMGFSTDRAQLEAAIDGLGLVQPFEQLSDPLRLNIAEVKYTDDSLGGAANATGILREMLRDLSTFTARNTRNQLKAQILDLSANLDALAGVLDSASGRKQVLLFSQGFDSEVVFGTRDMERIAESAEDANQGNFWRVDAEELYGASDAQTSLLQMLERFNRSDCVVHTIDVGGLVAGGDAAETRVGSTALGTQRLDRGHDGLALMANETGGEFYRNFNDLTEAMDDLLERTSVTYVLSIRPKQSEMDGSYHPIQVRLKNPPKGADISHRPGYYARRPYSELDPMERVLTTAESLVAGAAGGQIGTNLLAAAFPGYGSASNVLTAIEIDGASLTTGAADNMVPTEIYTYAFDGEGQIRDFFSQAVMLDLYKVGYRLERGFKLLSHLELPPGTYEIRSLVRNARTGASGLAVSKLKVPDYVEGEQALLPPFFIEPDDLWLVGMADRTRAEDVPYPLMGGGGKRMVPASRPQLVSGQRTPMLLVGYDLPEEVVAEGRLVGSDGSIYQDVDISVEERVDSRNEGDRLMTTLTAQGVKPGSYHLVVTLRGEGREVSSSVPVLFGG